MADRYVDSAAGGTASGADWTNAYLTIKAGTDAAAAGEKVYVASGHAETYTAATVLTFAAGVQLISADKTSGTPPTTYTAGASMTSTTNSATLYINGQGACFGVTFKGSTGTNANVIISRADNSNMYLEGCTIHLQSASAAAQLGMSDTAANQNGNVVTRNCVLLFANTGHSITMGGRWRSIGDTFCSSGTVPTVLITDFSRNSCDVVITGADLSAVSTTLVVGNGGGAGTVRISSSKLHATVTPMGSTTSGGSSEIFLNDCSYDNAGTLTGYLFYHENHCGSTTISTAIYANDGAQYDGTNRCSWVVDGKTAASFSQPYESPWIDVYNGDVATSVTPNLECVRSGSATAYTDEIVWAEFAARDTANSARLTLTHNRRGPLTAAANQTTGALAAGDWTGENATSWFGKLDAPAAFTPDEVGYMRARVCVTGDNTVYVDPKIRGLA